MKSLDTDNMNKWKHTCWSDDSVFVHFCGDWTRSVGPLRSSFSELLDIASILKRSTEQENDRFLPLRVMCGHFSRALSIKKYQGKMNTRLEKKNVGKNNVAVALLSSERNASSSLSSYRKVK